MCTQNSIHVPLSPLLFCIGLQSVLEEFEAKYRDILINAFQDDISIIIDPEKGDGKEQIDFLRSKLAEIGLSLNDDKTEVCEENGNILGIPFGTDEFVAKQLDSKEEEINDDITTLETSGITLQSQLVLMRSTIVTKIAYLLRGVDPSQTANWRNNIDQAIEKWLGDQLKPFHLNEAAKKQMKFPMRNGGCALGTPDPHISYAKCLALSFKCSDSRVKPILKDVLDQFLSECQHPSMPQDTNLSVDQKLNAWFKNNKATTEMSSLRPYNPHDVEDSPLLNKFFDRRVTMFDKLATRWLSLSNLNRPDFRLSDSEVQLGLFDLLGLQVCSSISSSARNCRVKRCKSQPLDHYGIHSKSCQQFAGARTNAHDIMVTKVAAGLRKAGLRVRIEPRVDDPDSKRRSDIRCLLRNKIYDLDVMITRPLRQGALIGRRSAEPKPGDEAAAGEKTKRRSYEGVQLTGDLVPFVMEDTGRVGKEGMEFIKMIRSDLRAQESNEDRSDCRNGKAWWKDFFDSLGMGLVRGKIALLHRYRWQCVGLGHSGWDGAQYLSEQVDSALRVL